MKWLIISITLFLAVTPNEAFEAIKDDNNVMIEDDASVESIEAKRKIVSYNKALMSEEEISDEKHRLKVECDCEIEHLKSAGAFVLTFKTAEEKNTKDLKLDTTKEAAADDDVMGIYQEL